MFVSLVTINFVDLNIINLKKKIMLSILVYLLLAGINLPFALEKSNKNRGFNWASFGFCLGLMTAHIINNHLR